MGSQSVLTSVFLVMTIVIFYYRTVSSETTQTLKGSGPGYCKDVMRNTERKWEATGTFSVETYRTRCTNGRWGCIRRRRRPNGRYVINPVFVNVTVCCVNYKYDPGSDTCQPQCQPSCLNAKCIAPNQCQCNEGYAKAPGVAESSTCLRECNPVCVNAACNDNGECECLNGYTKSADKNNECTPFCDNYDKKTSICTAPGNCQCLKGYKRDSADEICKPECNDLCVNGFCSEPNVCTCNEGYKLDPEKAQCTAVCSENCINGNCVEPDTCECLKGYSLNETNHFQCDVVCSKPCMNGFCSGPDECTCLEGYSKNKDDSHQCDPICSRRCHKGTCVAPDKCKCDEGYKSDVQDPFSCSARCSKPCLNGWCDKPEKCACFPRYRLEEETGICWPTCRRNCVNATCTAYDVCTCLGGHVSTPRNKYVCTPKCQNDCINGDCIGPDLCSCHSGYGPLVNASYCPPICDSCFNGTCEEPGKCVCGDGYQLNESGYCTPVCRKTCLHGYCSSPDFCTCFEGYEGDVENGLICKPKCEPNCINGECAAPNTCLCNEDYVLVNDSLFNCTEKNVEPQSFLNTESCDEPCTTYEPQSSSDYEISTDNIETVSDKDTTFAAELTRDHRWKWVYIPASILCFGMLWGGVFKMIRHRREIEEMTSTPKTHNDWKYENIHLSGAGTLMKKRTLEVCHNPMYSVTGCAPENHQAFDDFDTMER